MDGDNTITAADPPMLPRQVLPPVPFSLRSVKAVEAEHALVATTVEGPNLFVSSDTGKVGVGTDKPKEKLEVVGNVKAQKFVGDGSMLSGVNSDDTDWTESDNNLFRLDGNVAIGTTSAEARLHVNGEVKIGNSSAPCDSAREGALRYNSSSKKLEFGDDSGWSEAFGPTDYNAGDYLLISRDEEAVLDYNPGGVWAHLGNAHQQPQTTFTENHGGAGPGIFPF